MKYIACFILLLGNHLTAISQFNTQLCKTNEEIVFAFQLNNKKWVSVFQEKNEAYIVYRFGRSNNIELQFPDKLDSTSRQQFSFKGYERGGGKQNAAMRFAFLRFERDSVGYEIYDEWNSEDDESNCGIRVTSNSKQIDMTGILRTKKNSLLSLLFSKIKMVEGDD